MFIKGISIGGYRSFGPEPQRIGPCEKVNLLVGPNNSGKSNVLSFLKEQFPAMLASTRRYGEGLAPSFKDRDRHIGEGTKLTFGLALSMHDLILADAVQENAAYRATLEEIFHSEILSGGTGLAWFEFQADAPGQQLDLAPAVQSGLKDVASPQRWQSLWIALTRTRGGELEKHWIPGTLQKLSPAQCEYPNPDKPEPYRFEHFLTRTSRNHTGLSIS